ncbi:MAG: hypothetical protein IRZ33_08330 [Alicyclobacillaceae bacterium]|nr:hypothetical protein [Alicyclobacillaceae bacterium]
MWSGLQARMDAILSPAWENAASAEAVVRWPSWLEAGTGSLAHPFDRARLLRGSVRMGATVGLFLGSISLLLFHHIQPSYQPVSATRDGTVPAETAAARVTVPAVRLYALESARFPDPSKLRAAQEAGQKRGITSVVDARDGRRLMYAAAALSAHLVDEHRRLQSAGVSASIIPLWWDASSTKVAGLASAEVPSVTHWLAAETSALCALFAVMQDGEPERDAQTAYRYARTVEPKWEAMRMASPSAIGAPGHASSPAATDTQQLRLFAAAVDRAFASLHKGDQSAAEGDALTALAMLGSWGPGR